MCVCVCVNLYFCAFIFGSHYTPHKILNWTFVYAQMYLNQLVGNNCFLSFFEMKKKTEKKQHETKIEELILNWSLDPFAFLVLFELNLVWLSHIDRLGRYVE